MGEETTNHDYLKVQKEYCDLYKIDFNQVQALNETVIRIVGVGLKKCSLLALKDAYADIHKNINYWTKVWHFANSEEAGKKPQEKSLLDLFLYLLLVEGVSAKLVDAIAFILMENHHELYDPERRKFLQEYKSLDKLSLSIKLQFLEKHGFELLTNAIDKDLRNCIAHIDIIVNEDGSIVNNRTKERLVDLKQRTDYLGGIGAIILNVLDYELDKLGLIEK